MARPLTTHTPLGRLCMAHGIRLVDVAITTRIRYSNLSDICQGKYPPTADQLTRLAEAFKVPPETFDYDYVNATTARPKARRKQDAAT